MRFGAGFFFAICFATGLCAQIRGTGSVVYPGGAPGTPGVTRTVGSVVNPAGGVPHQIVPGTRGAATGAYRSRGVYAYPVYIGGGSYVPYISQYDSTAQSPDQTPAQPNVTIVMPPQQPVTPVVINYNYGTPPPPNPDVANEQAQPSDDTAAEASHYLIAFKDHTIYAATAYWVDGDTLHYFTAGNVHNQASLSLVDRDFTARLNKEAGVEVSLPAPAAK